VEIIGEIGEYGAPTGKHGIHYLYRDGRQKMGSCGGGSAALGHWDGEFLLR